MIDDPVLIVLKWERTGLWPPLYRTHTLASIGLTAPRCKAVTKKWPWLYAPLKNWPPALREVTMKAHALLCSAASARKGFGFHQPGNKHRSASSLIWEEFDECPLRAADSHALFNAFASWQTRSPFCFDHSPCKRSVYSHNQKTHRCANMHSQGYLW